MKNYTVFIFFIIFNIIYSSKLWANLNNSIIVKVDKKIVLVECFRNKIPQKFSYNINNTKHKKAEFCTMKNGKHV